MTSRQGVSLPYQAGLDGVRALAVIAVLCFHQGFPWASGGFLGVSLFFTLSGYLITRLLVVEHIANGRIALRAFWARRARRLGPAMLLALAGVIVLGAAVLPATQLTDLKGDLFAALGYVANWRFLVEGSEYADLFASPSLVQHFWSLAIEEQFYLVFPLVVAFVLWIGRGSRVVLGLVLLAGMAGSLASTLVAGSADRIYYGTDTRALELLAGALLALFAPRIARVTRARGVLAAAGVLGLVAFAWWVTGTKLATPIFSEGGFALVAITSVAVLVGATTTGPVATVLSIWPMRALGKISYGVYLFHWPVYLWLDDARTGLDGWALFGLRNALVLALSVLSYQLVELPIRTGRRFRAPRFGPAFVGSVTAVTVAAALVVTAPRADQVIDASDFRRAAAIPEPPPAPSPAPSAVAPVTPATVSLKEAIPDPMRVYVVGDSTGLSMGHGLYEWGQTTGKVVVKQGAKLACGVLRGARLRAGERELPAQTLAACDRWPERWPLEILSTVPDVIVVIMGPAHTADVLLPHDSQWRGLGDPTLDDTLWREMSYAADILEGAGVPILWFDTPYLAAGTEARVGNQAHPVRIDRYNQMVQRLADERELVVHVPWAQILAAHGDDASLRPDGVHVEAERAPAVLDAGLWSEIVKQFLGVHATRAAAASASAAAVGAQ